MDDVISVTGSKFGFRPLEGGCHISNRVKVWVPGSGEQMSYQ